MLSLSLVNIFYIISGFLLNFKEISRFVLDCCAILEPFKSKVFRDQLNDTVTLLPITSYNLFYIL